MYLSFRTNISFLQASTWKNSFVRPIALWCSDFVIICAVAGALLTNLLRFSHHRNWRTLSCIHKARHNTLQVRIWPHSCQHRRCAWINERSVWSVFHHGVISCGTSFLMCACWILCKLIWMMYRHVRVCAEYVSVCHFFSLINAFLLLLLLLMVMMTGRHFTWLFKFYYFTLKLNTARSTL